LIYYSFTPEEKLLVAILYGEVTNQEITDLVEKNVSIDDVSGQYRGLLVLCSNVTGSELKTSTIISAGRRMNDANFRKGSKNAIVAKTPLTYGFARMYQIIASFSKVDEIRVFKAHGLPEAIAWLGLDRAQSFIGLVDHYENTP